MTRLHVVFILCVGLLPNAFAERPGCPRKDEQRADAALDGLRSWDRLYDWYREFRQCDDGIFAEGYSEAVARNLVDHWRTLPRLAVLATKDVGFREFVLKHVDRTLDDNDLKKISANSVQRCPSGLDTLCRDLKKQAEAP